MSKKKCFDSSRDSTQEKGKPIKIADQEHGDLLPMATKAIGMELCRKNFMQFKYALSI